MFKTVLSLQWKEFNRGKSVGGKLVAKIFKWFWIIYFAFMSVMMGIIASAYGGPSMEFPIKENSTAPFEFVNGQLIYFFAYLIVMRYFIQSLPVFENSFGEPHKHVCLWTVHRGDTMETCSTTSATFENLLCHYSEVH